MNVATGPHVFPLISPGRDEPWEKLPRIFASCEPLVLAQSWREAPQPGLKEGRVWAGIAEENLAVYAELEDDDIYNRSQSLNEKTWTLGDVFEIFFKSASTESYHEFHVTPENQKLQLQFPSEEDFRAKRPWGTHCLGGDVFFSRARVETGRWKVHAEIPLRLFAGAPWQFSFCRYDATRGEERPVVSSTSILSMRDFHRLCEWRRGVRGE